MEKGEATKKPKRVLCFCKKPARECVVSNSSSSENGRVYFICAEEECEFHRWGDEEFVKRKDRPQNPNIIGTAFKEEDVEEKSKPVWEQIVSFNIYSIYFKNLLQIFNFSIHNLIYIII